MSTMKINMKDRYAMGWTDPRMPQFGKTNLEDVPTEVLRNLWLAKFGERYISVDATREYQKDDIMNVVQELIDRGQVRHERFNRPDTMEILDYYILEKEDGNN